MLYNDWYARVLNYCAVVSTAVPIGPLGNVSSYTDPYWVMELPRIIEDSENRIFKDTDLLAWRVTDRTGVLVPNQRQWALPLNAFNQTFRKVEQINIVGTSSDPVPADVRQVIDIYSRAYVDWAWPSNSTYNGMPKVAAMENTNTVIFGPAPDQGYSVEVIGPQTQQPLSITNQGTFLSMMLPDLWFAATMVNAMAFQRDLGSMSENPQASVNWEQRYQNILKSAQVEEAGRWYRSAGWTSQNPTPVSTPPRV